MKLKDRSTPESGVSSSEQEKEGWTELDVLGQSSVGVVKVNLDGEIIYANQKMLEIIDTDSYQGKTLQNIFNEANLEKVTQEVKRRSQGESGEYEAFMTKSDGRIIPVLISAVPKRDSSGKINGSIALVRSLEVEHCVAKIHKEIESKQDSKDMLQTVAAITAGVIPFDLFSVSIFSASGRHVRELINYSPEGEQTEWGVRWWEVPEEIVKEMQSQNTPTCINDLQKYFSATVWDKFKHRQKIKEFLAAGYCSRLSSPVIQAGSIIGIVGLYRKSEPYRPMHEAIFKSLPLDKAVIMAVSLEERKAMKFRLDLMTKLSTICEDVQDVGELMVNSISDHFALDVVYLFMVDENRSEFRLMSQAGPKKLRNDYTQTLQDGVLSLVYKKNKDLEIGKYIDFNIPNVWENEAASSVFRPIYTEVKSKICLPIRTREAFWILNIEDPQESAFSQEEFEALQAARNEISSFLSRSWLFHSMQKTLESSSDAFISTDGLGRIKRVNPAACHLLGRSEADLIESDFKEYFKDREISEEVLLGGNFPNREVVWRKHGGEDLRVLLSGAPLPQMFDRRIFFAKDLSLQKKLEELEYLEKFTAELAMQIKTPLSLMFSWLSRLKDQTVDFTAAETLDKTIQQLKRVELTFDRLAFFGYGESKSLFPYTAMSLSAREILRTLEKDLPRTELERIDFQVEDNLPLFQGCLAQLAFCLETIVSYLMRFLPEKEKMAVSFSRREHQLVVDVCGVCPKESSEGPSSVMNVALGTHIMKQFIEEDHKGRFCQDFDEKKQTLHFAIKLPMVDGESHADTFGLS